MPRRIKTPEEAMRLALELARRGEGQVEPNPMVGAVVVDPKGNVLGTGWHQKFGGPHAEVFALREAGRRAAGTNLFTTLEPCCHTGKTPPCVDAIIAAGILRVYTALQDPFPAVAGQGIARLRAAGIDVRVGLLQAEAERLAAPFLKLVRTGLPYVHAKWAMTLDGKLAARTGISKWISNEASRAVVHRLRGRMDAILVGIETALLDDPLLTARPAGPRVATRIVVDSRARLPQQSQLLQTITQAPVIVAACDDAPAEQVQMLRDHGVEVLLFAPAVSAASSAGAPGRVPLTPLLQELGRRRFTNILVEGGSGLLGSLFDDNLIDHTHVFIAPKVLGGSAAKSPIGGTGLDSPELMPRLENPRIEILDGDVYVEGPLRPAH